MGLDLKQLILIFLIVLLLFGGKKLPALARSIGQGISEFKKGLSNIEERQVETTEVYHSPEEEEVEAPAEKDITPPPKKLAAPAAKSGAKKTAAVKKTTTKKTTTKKSKKA